MTNAEIRRGIVTDAITFLDVPYKFGYEWIDPQRGVKPPFMDCSEFVEGLYKINGLMIPDGSSNQFMFCRETSEPLPGDLGFFGDAERGIYHVGILYDNSKMIEARGTPYDKVIMRPLIAWQNYKNFKGFRSHPALMI